MGGGGGGSAAGLGRLEPGSDQMGLIDNRDEHREREREWEMLGRKRSSQSVVI